jgi:wyosine [tRNA(Phe)-imidazoG37] synthetase (radical SAM superfamily)
MIRARSSECSPAASQCCGLRPVPSRRLGRSLGINNISPKSCSYSCLYCQVGTTLRKTVVPDGEPGLDINLGKSIELLRPLGIPIAIISNASLLWREQIEYLNSYEGDAFAFTGDIHKDLLSITAVHPMRESAVRFLLEKAQADWEVIDQLVTEGKLVETEYQGERFYLRRFSK